MNMLAAPPRRLARGVQTNALVLRDDVDTLELPRGDARLSPRAHLYFAYGADLNPDLMRRRCPGSRVVGVGSLAGFALTFAGWSRTWSGGTLTLVPSASSRVDGVLYLVSNVSLADLDRIQGCPRVYQRVTVGVGGDDGRGEAHAYCMRPPLVRSQPNAAYLAMVCNEYARLRLDTAPLFKAIDALR